jgi:hypothetical protein
VRVRLQREVDVEASARAVWDFVTDWPRQGEWVPLTRVERVDPAADVGGRFRAWTGLGPLGFWDPMTITAWERSGDGGGRCEVLHRGTVVKGEGEFVVLARGPQASRSSTYPWAGWAPRAGAWRAQWSSGFSTAAWTGCAGWSRSRRRCRHGRPNRRRTCSNRPESGMLRL